jgi:hypothetical protein
MRPLKFAGLPLPIHFVQNTEAPFRPKCLATALDRSLRNAAGCPLQRRCTSARLWPPAASHKGPHFFLCYGRLALGRRRCDTRGPPPDPLRSLRQIADTGRIFSFSTPCGSRAPRQTVIQTRHSDHIFEEGGVLRLRLKRP